MATSALTLTDFLLARIAEQELAARAAFTEFAPRTRESWLRWLEADCAAKRKIVEVGDDTVLRIMAGVYAGHPGYRAEWRYATPS